MQKRVFIVLIILVMLAGFYGCGNPSAVSSGQKEASKSESIAEAVAILYTDFTCGSEVVDATDIVQKYDYTYSGELSADILARGLSELSGLDFTLGGAKAVADGLVIDWSASSTLVAGLDDRGQKEEFFFFDVDSLDWFMMDSLCTTLKENLGVENIYYTMDGGKTLLLPNLSAVQLIPPDSPYMGSAFYYAHSDVKGDDMAVFDQGAAMSMLSDLLADKISEMSAAAPAGSTIAIVADGEEVIGEANCWLFSLGMDSVEKFTAEEHYAVSDTGGVYVMNILNGGEYEEYVVG